MYSLRIGQNVRLSYWMLPLSLLFLVGGVIQYIGLLSLTQSNFLVLALISPIFLMRKARKEIRHELLLIVLGAHVIIVGIVRGVEPNAIATYLYYIACTIGAAVSARFICNYTVMHRSTASVQCELVKLSKLFLAIQVVVCLLQNVFIQEVIAHAPFPVIPEDAVFGTMFLKSDASLAAVSEALILSIFIIPSTLRDKIAISALGVLVIYMGGSKAAQVIVWIVVVAILIRHLGKKLGLVKAGINYLIAILGMIAVALFYGKVENALSDFTNKTIFAYQHRDAWGTADRLAPIGQMLGEKLKILGDGPLTYYNPLTKSWLYDAGFSTFYSLYIDLGIIGLILYALYYSRLIWISTRNILLFLLFAFIVISFAAFNLTLSDIAFAFVINFALRLNQISHVTGAMRKELSA